MTQEIEKGDIVSEPFDEEKILYCVVSYIEDEDRIFDRWRNSIEAAVLADKLNDLSDEPLWSYRSCTTLVRKKEVSSWKSIIEG